jgi:hypothetical protein
MSGLLFTLSSENTDLVGQRLKASEFGCHLIQFKGKQIATYDTDTVPQESGYSSRD